MARPMWSYCSALRICAMTVDVLRTWPSVHTVFIPQMIASVDLDCVMKLYACKAPGAGAKMYAVAALVVALIAILAYFLLQ